jgi:hypothetical protein
VSLWRGGDGGNGPTDLLVAVTITVRELLAIFGDDLLDHSGEEERRRASQGELQRQLIRRGGSGEEGGVGGVEEQEDGDGVVVLDLRERERERVIEAERDEGHRLKKSRVWRGTSF